MIINKILKILKKNIFIILAIIIFIFLCIIVKNNYMDIVNKVDDNVHEFFVNKIINSSLTRFMSNITYLGSTVAVILVFAVIIFLTKDKLFRIILSLDLTFLYFLRTLLKNTFRRPRPDYAMINNLKDFSFPSGHTLFAVGFYGSLIYFLWKCNINKIIKYILTFIISIIILLVCTSRIYLGVHYFSDVLAGFILGILSIILFIGIYNNSDWRIKK